MFMIDGKSAGNFPAFGSFLPTGIMEGHLYVGGVSPESSALVPLGVTTEGYKGCLDQVYLLGRPVDFSTNVRTKAVVFQAGRCEASCFNGSAIEQYGKHYFILQYFPISTRTIRLRQTGA